LEFPLALRHFGVDAFVVDAGEQAEVEMLLDDLARDRTDVRIADAGVIRALRRRITLRREAERTAVLVYPDSSIVRKITCHGAILGFVMGHDLRRLFVSR